MWRRAARWINALRHEDSGQMAIAMMFGLIFVFFVIAFALDAGLWYFDHRWAQNQAEAAALAAVDALPSSSVGTRQAAIDKADLSLERNGIPATAIPVQRVCPIDASDTQNLPATPTTNLIDSARVCVRRPSPVIFAKLAKIDQVYVSAAARAQVRMVPLPYAVMAMQSCSPNPSITVDVGTVVNLLGGGGTYTEAANCSNALNVQGTLTSAVNHAVSGPGACSGAICTQVEAIGDPFADFPQPTLLGGCTTLPPLPSPPIRPGNYCSGGGVYTIASGQSLDLDCAGLALSECVFIFQNTQLDIHGTIQQSGNSNGGPGVTLPGVTLFFTCNVNPCGAGATIPAVTVFDGATMSLVGNPDPAFARTLFWLDRNARGRLQITKTTVGANLSLDGRVYAYKSDVQVEVSSAAGPLGTPLDLNIENIVANTITFTGGGNIAIIRDPSNPLLQRTVALVE
jgi:hypothetical protein